MEPPYSIRVTPAGSTTGPITTPDQPISPGRTSKVLWPQFRARQEPTYGLRVSSSRRLQWLGAPSVLGAFCLGGGSDVIHRSSHPALSGTVSTAEERPLRLDSVPYDLTAAVLA